DLPPGRAPQAAPPPSLIATPAPRPYPHGWPSARLDHESIARALGLRSGVVPAAQPTASPARGSDPAPNTPPAAPAAPSARALPRPHRRLAPAPACLGLLR